jgi:modified peptide precursor CbpA
MISAWKRGCGLFCFQSQKHLRASDQAPAPPSDLTHPHLGLPKQPHPPMRCSDSIAFQKGGDSMKTTKKAATRPIIATRKSCNVNGTGLSHYVMMDGKK